MCNNFSALKIHLKSILWILAEFGQNRMVGLPHDNYFSVCRQHKENWGFVKTTIHVASGKNHTSLRTKLPNSSYSITKYWLYKNLIIFLVFANNKTIYLPTSSHCYFYQLKFFKNIDYDYYLLAIYTKLHSAWICCQLRSVFTDQSMFDQNIKLIWTSSKYFDSLTKIR